MTALGIAHVELYVNDLESAVEYLVSSFGFTPEAESAPAEDDTAEDDTAEDDTADGHPNDSVRLRQGSVRLIVTAGPGTSDFLAAHGEGVADIAITCDDVAATADAAVAAGAEVASSGPRATAIRGFGDVRHTLLPAAAGADRLPPPGGHVRRLDHVAVCVPAGTLASFADFYAALGLRRYSSEYVDFGDHAMDSVVVRSESGGITFTLVAPESAKRPGQLDAFLDRNGGPGVQHLAYDVADIIAAVGEFRNRGVTFLRTPETYYDMLAERLSDMRAEISSLRAAGVLADRDEWGYLFQLFTHSPHERNTLFYELIQRRGARGFGSANIRALYEAVDRAERLAAG